MHDDFGQEFERDFALELIIARQPDNAHSASAQNFDQRVAAKDSLPAGELTRRRVCDIARAFVSHLDRVYIIKMGRKFKAGGRSPLQRLRIRARSQELASPNETLCVHHDFLVERFCMNASQDEGAWLEAADGKRHPIHGSCSLGRTAANTIVLESPKVSRRHALIHLQNIGEPWLIDFGSSNGTFLNKRRIHQPVRLSDGDQITIGDEVFKFRQPLPISDEYKTVVTQRTLREIENIPCWLLVADIRSFTPLSRRMQSEDLDVLLGAWIFACKEIIENHHGIINKYLGDGFLAYWADAATTREEIVAVISALTEFQQKGGPDFRFVVHFGPVAIGGIASMGEESLMGAEVNLIFRLEKLAGSLGEPCGLSETAHTKVGELVSARSLGKFELKGFEGKRAFFAL